MDAALTPREIQARVRAGQSVDELVAASGMTAKQIEPFAGPVLAERAWLASQATRGQVRRDTGSAHQTLLELVGDRLASRGLSTSDVTWDAWRGAERLWTLRASYHSGSALHEAVFRYDPAGRFSTAVNDEARWLIGETSSAHGPQPGRRSPAREADGEPTIDLAQTRRLRIRDDEADLFEFEPTGYTRLTEVDGVFDLVSDPGGGDDVMYDILASITEDSVRIYPGLSDDTDDEPTTQHTVRPARTARAASRTKTASRIAQQAEPRPTHQAETVPSADESKEPTARVPKSKKRVTVPTWDEIMFGSPQA